MNSDFKTSRTAINLMRAFAGESQARNRYTFAADQAKNSNLHVIEAVFRFTADQEKEHAEIFYNHLSSLAGETIQIDGGYPVDPKDTVIQLLRSAQHNEYEEWQDAYQSFGDVASEEGYMPVATSFYKIAEIEKLLASNGRILVRPSGTEPLIRVMTEAENLELCHKYNQEVIDLIKEKGYAA